MSQATATVCSGSPSIAQESLWSSVPLGQILKHQRTTIRVRPDRTYPNFGIYSFGRGTFVKQPIDGGSSSATSLYRAVGGQFVYSRLFAFEGAYATVGDELDGHFVSNEFPLFEVDPSKLDVRYLGWLFKSPHVWNEVAMLTTGMGDRRRRVKPEQFLTYHVPLPPLEEQRRIVATIEQLAAMIDEACGMRRRSERAVEQWVPSVAHRLFAEDLPRKAEQVNLGDVTEVRSGVTLGRHLAGELIEFPYLRVANVQDGYLDLDTMKTVWIKAEERDKWQLEHGDLLLTEGGDWDKLGRGTIWREEIPNCIHQNHIFRVRLGTSEFDPEYVLSVLRSPYGKDYFKEASKQTTNLASINQRQLKAFPIFKVSLDEQRHIVTYLDGLQAKVDRLKALQQKTAAELDALLPAILDRAFKGEL